MMAPDDHEARAVKAIQAAFEIVRTHAPAEVEIVISSDRDGNIRLREKVAGVSLAALMPEPVDTA